MSLMSAAIGKKAKNSNLKGNAFGDRSASYRKHNYQPMINVMNAFASYIIEGFSFWRWVSQT